LTQFKIEKAELQGRTFTQVRVVGEEDRVVEVARMLAGEEIGENALANARELLAQRDS
jgi:DNA repair protein RecN (Recombination protein N)